MCSVLLEHIEKTTTTQMSEIVCTHTVLLVFPTGFGFWCTGGLHWPGAGAVGFPNAFVANQECQVGGITFEIEVCVCAF